jgi:hypothetical protein
MPVRRCEIAFFIMLGSRTMGLCRTFVHFGGLSMFFVHRFPPL